MEYGRARQCRRARLPAYPNGAAFLGTNLDRATPAGLRALRCSGAPAGVGRLQRNFRYHQPGDGYTFTDSVATDCLLHRPRLYGRLNSIVVTGGGTRDIILQSESNSSVAYTATDTSTSSITTARISRPTLPDGACYRRHRNDAYERPDHCGRDPHRQRRFLHRSRPLNGFDVVIVRAVAVYSAPTTATVATAIIVAYDGETLARLLLRPRRGRPASS
jgi:hypothetical protein